MQTPPVGSVLGVQETPPYDPICVKHSTRHTIPSQGDTFCRLIHNGPIVPNSPDLRNLPE